MGLLKKRFKEIIKKESLGSEIEYIPMYRTGIDIFDYINGYQRADGVIEIGIRGSRVTMDIGNSGTGKTSKVIQQACFIASQFEDTDIWHYDYERSSSKERIMQLAGWDEETFNEKYNLFQRGISAETIYNACKQIEKVKLDMYEDIKIDSGMVDNDGKPVYILPPTILIIDSIAFMAPEDIESSDELRGSTGAMAIAKSNTNIFKRIASPCINANIIVMTINHITSNVSINPMARSQAALNFLKADESIPGGRNITFQTDTLTKLITGSKLDPDKEFGIKGFYLNGMLIKSRNTAAGISFKMVFEQRYGVNNLLTNFVNLKEAGRISGAGRSFKLDTCPDVKFSQKEFMTKYYTNPKLKEAFDNAVHDEYMKYVSMLGIPVTKLNFTIGGGDNGSLELLQKKTAGYTTEATAEDENGLPNDGYTIFNDTDPDQVIYTKGGKYYIHENGKFIEVELEN